ncbi:hypothetical protein OKC48_06875 [Methylorubrum extorquens]|uniref:hypothetical protein n=1 Tax=Methylorubrum extorquens TaxID=408 RepID=UPI0022379A1D|nr:hypothetical protein [Methylorubrum extorquens]UYW28237.1 hypothetical protein OKC48_06875 [Methylorubrum extorquens]
MNMDDRGTPYAKIGAGTPDEIWVTDDGIYRGNSAFGCWTFYRGDTLLFSVRKEAAGEAPSVALLETLLAVHDRGVRAGVRQGYAEGHAALQGTLRKALGMPAIEDDAAAMMALVEKGFIPRETAEAALRLTV